jgi:hypothetical protein
VSDDKAKNDKALSTVAHCHCNRTTIPPSIAFLPPSLIAIMLPPLPSPTAAAIIHGN